MVEGLDESLRRRVETLLEKKLSKGFRERWFGC